MEHTTERAPRAWMGAAAALLALSLFAAGCVERVGRGNPRTLAPILGGGGPAGTDARPPGEPVEDLVLDLATLRAAWPEVERELPGLIRTLIARGSWTDVHHAATASGAVLRVRHRPAVIAEVRKLVGGLARSLLRPVSIHVAFVEARAADVDGLFPVGAGGERWRRFEHAAFRAAARRGRARYLARAMLSTYNGRWANSERLSNQTQLSGVDVAEGAIRPRSIALATGAAVQAAAWRWGDGRAVVALSGLYTGSTSDGGPTVSQTVHRELPRTKTTEMSWQGHEITFALPGRELVELQGALTVDRGVWTVAGLSPRDGERVCAVVVKVDWRPLKRKPAAIAPLSPAGADLALRVVPIALPTRARPPRTTGLLAEDLRNRAALATQAATQVTKRVRSKQKVQAAETYNLQDFSGSLALSAVARAGAVDVRARTYYRRTESWVGKKNQQRGPAPTARVFGAMPPGLEALKAEVMRQQWPEGTAVEFVANHVFVVHRAEVADKLARLLRGTHRWRNQRAVVRVGFPVLPPDRSDALADGVVDAKQARALRAGKQTAAPAYLLARGGSRTAMFVGEMATVLSEAWPPDRSSPAAHVFWRGRRLSVLPRLQPDRALGHCLELELKTHRLARTAPASVGGAVVQHPVDATWVHRRQLCLPRGDHALTGATGADSAEALLIGADVLGAPAARE